MKLIIIIIVLLISSLKMSRQIHLVQPRLRSGEYRIDIKAIYKCENVNNHTMKFNIFLNKVSTNTSVIQGNYTNEIPFDDNLFFNIGFDVKDSIGRWQENSLQTITKSKACTTCYTLIKKEYFYEFGLVGTCPKPVGFHIIPGISTQNMEKKIFNIPKILTYGTYKVHLGVSNKNKKIEGCFILLAEVKRPWENY